MVIFAVMKEYKAQLNECTGFSIRCVSSLNAEEYYLRSGFHRGDKIKHRFRNGVEINCILMSRMVGQNEQNYPVQATTAKAAERDL